MSARPQCIYFSLMLETMTCCKTNHEKEEMGGGVGGFLIQVLDILLEAVSPVSFRRSFTWCDLV